eukprot:CAMPEP_0118665910 /NCGR_PEP_ID=MMETSP0785-20121206/18904_1 /TAXON_ID=91992 /ORGANISM="Bolidomonas pacifica, Strain CCMP 1866" /LENGTH=99 /DNA_ID=CAMNT_0006560127 /DNA_START=148 /DNA_END=443 /DNA_ORIENTATION=-
MSPSPLPPAVTLQPVRRIPLPSYLNPFIPLLTLTLLLHGLLSSIRTIGAPFKSELALISSDLPCESKGIGGLPLSTQQLMLATLTDVSPSSPYMPSTSS